MSTDLVPSAVPRLIVSICAFLSVLCADQARAEGGERPPESYASLPSHSSSHAAIAPTTLLPASDRNGQSDFQQLVGRGAIMLRASAPIKCLPPGLRSVVADVAVKFGQVSIESTHRTSSYNGRAGGARHSLHLSCRAADLRVRTRSRGLMAYLRSRPEVGGLKVYRTGIIHIDNGERRSW